MWQSFFYLCEPGRIYILLDYLTIKRYSFFARKKQGTGCRKAVIAVKRLYSFVKSCTLFVVFAHARPSSQSL
jgi:hypothetical protein